MIGLIKYVALFATIGALSAGTTVTIGRMKEKRRFEAENNARPIEEEEDEPITYTHLDYFIDALTNIKVLEGDVNLSLSYNSYDINLDGYVYIELDLNDTKNIVVDGDFNISINDIDISLGASYINETIYLDLFSNHIKAKTASISEITNIISSFDIPLELPSELENIDLNDLLIRFSNMEIEEFSDHLSYSFNIFDNQKPILFTSNLDYQLTSISILGLTLGDISIKGDASTNVLNEKKDITNPDDIYNYVDMSNYFGIINQVVDIIDKKQIGFGFNINAKYNKNPNFLTFNGDINLDFNNFDLELDSSFTFNSYTSSLFARYLKDTIYLNYNDVIKLSYSKKGIGELIDIIKNNVNNEVLEALFDKLDNIEISIPLIDAIKNKDYKALVSLINDGLIVLGDNSIKINIPTGKEDDFIKVEINLSNSGLNNLKVTNLNLLGFEFDICVDVKSYSTPKDINEEEYDRIEPLNNVINNISNLINQKEFAFDISGTLKTKSLDLSFNGDTQFSLINDSGSGKLSILDQDSRYHNVAIDVYDIPSSTSDFDNESYMGKMYFSYNDCLKGSFSLNDMRSLIDLVKRVIRSDSERINQYIRKFSEGPLGSIINSVKNGEYEKLYIKGLINELHIEDTNINVSIDLSKLGFDNGYINLTIYYEDLANINGVDLAISLSDISLSLSLGFKDYDTNYKKLDLNDTYIDFSDIKILADYFINTAKLDLYHLKGNVDLSFLNIVNKEANIDMYVGITKNDDNSETCYVKGKLYNIPTMALVNWKDGLATSNKALEFYYDNLSNDVYLYASQKVNCVFWTEYRNSYVKVDGDYFIQNILYYLCSFGLGLSDSIISAMTKNEERTEPIKVEKILKSFICHSDVPSWDISIDLKELANNDSMRDLNATIYGKDSYLSRIVASTNIEASIISISLGLDASLTFVNETFPMDKFNSYVNAHKNDINGHEYSVTVSSYTCND